VSNSQQSNHSGQDLELSVRASKLAKRVGAATVGELARFSEQEILATKCFGETSLREIREKLLKYGLRLGMTPDQLNGLPFLQTRIVTEGQAGSPPAEAEPEGDCCGHCAHAARKLRERSDLQRKLNRSLPELDLSVRAVNCLESGGIVTVRDLVAWTPEELLQLRRLTKAMLDEVTARLAERGLRLGMALPGERAH